MEDSTKYRQALIRAADTQKAHYVLTGDCLLVEYVDLDQYLKTSSGIILAQGAAKQINSITANRPTFVRVLMVGSGYYGDDGELIPPDAKVGDVLLVGENSVQAISQFGKFLTNGKIRLGLTRDSETLMRFKGEEGFDAFFAEAARDE